jgi:FkbM family methyltransferase
MINHLEKEYSFRGRPYKVACVEHSGQAEPLGYRHPSWYTFEDEVDVREALWNIRKGDVVFDIGAAYGSYSLTALALGAAFVYAWSPTQDAGASEPQLFEASLALNGWMDQTVVYRHGLYSQSGWLNAATQEFTVEKPSELTVDHVRVERLDDSTAGGAPDIHWMKLDVEGAEVEVLKGAGATIRRARPVIVCENHTFKRKTLEKEVRDLLEGWGYRHVSTTPYHSVSHSLFEP